MYLSSLQFWVCSSCPQSLAFHVYCGNPGVPSYSVWQTSAASCNKAAPAKRNSAHNHKSLQGEARRDTQRESSNLKTTYISSSGFRLLNLTCQHRFAICIQHVHSLHTLFVCQRADFQLTMVGTIYHFIFCFLRQMDINGPSICHNPLHFNPAG